MLYLQELAKPGGDGFPFNIPKLLWIPLLALTERIFHILGRRVGRILPERWISLRAAVDPEGEDMNTLLAGGVAAGFLGGIVFIVWTLGEGAFSYHVVAFPSPIAMLAWLVFSSLLLGPMFAIGAVSTRWVLVTFVKLAGDFMKGVSGILLYLAEGKERRRDE
jgi:hypothetical protein